MKKIADGRWLPRHLCPAARLEIDENFGGGLYAVRPGTLRHDDPVRSRVHGDLWRWPFWLRVRPILAVMRVKDQSPTVVTVDVSREMKSNDEARRRCSEPRSAPPRPSMHYDGKLLLLSLRPTVDSTVSVCPVFNALTVKIFII